VPRDYPDDEWGGLVDATALLLDELGLKQLAQVARSEETAGVPLPRNGVMFPTF